MRNRKSRTKTLTIKIFSKITEKTKKLESFNICCLAVRHPKRIKPSRSKATLSWNSMLLCRQCIRKEETITSLQTWIGLLLQTRPNLWLNPRVLVLVVYIWLRPRTTQEKPCIKACRRIWPSKVHKGEGAIIVITIIIVRTIDQITDMLT